MADEEVALEQRYTGHLPGETVQVELGFFRHETNVKEVSAVLEHEDGEPFEIKLKGRSEETEPLSGGTKLCRVILSGILPSDAPSDI
jgi:hypothetical protein